MWERIDCSPLSLPFGEGRIGEQGGHDGLQRKRHAKLLHHVGLARIVEVDLHGRGPEHHVEAASAHFRHVIGHDPVTPLGHDRGFRKAPFGTSTEAEEPDVERLGNPLQMRQMPIKFIARLVHRVERRARKLELAAGLEGNRTPGTIVRKSDQVAVVLDRFPARALLQAFQQSPDPASSRSRPFIRHGGQVGAEKGELLVLCSDPGGIAGLAALLEPSRQFVTRFDGRGVRCVASHAVRSRRWPAWDAGGKKQAAGPRTLDRRKGRHWQRRADLADPAHWIAPIETICFAARCRNTMLLCRSRAGTAFQGSAK